MALAILTFSCFLLYATSKYFPKQGIKLVDQHKKAVILMASALSLCSLFLFTFWYDFATALVCWIIAFMTLLSAIILSIKLNYKWIWVWGGLSLIFILIDIV